MLVTTPGSTANLGAGFDCLALAVSLRFTFSDEERDDLLEVDHTHPAAVAYREAGGQAEGLWWRSPIPPGRGLGFSGAARVAGAALAIATRSTAAIGLSAIRREAFEVAARLESHPENAAASAFGGFVVCSGDIVAPTPTARSGLSLVAWYPETTTSTDQSRRSLPTDVPFQDAAFNLTRAALMVSGLITGNRVAICAGAEDRLHQDRRLVGQTGSLAAMSVFAEAPAVWACWMSGSGPTVAALVEDSDVADVVDSLPVGGTWRVLALDPVGLVIEPSE